MLYFNVINMDWTAYLTRVRMSCTRFFGSSKPAYPCLHMTMFVLSCPRSPTSSTDPHVSDTPHIHMNVQNRLSVSVGSIFRASVPPMRMERPAPL